MMQFDQVFWNADFGDYSGFDSVCDYVRSSRQACGAVADFLKARAQIEETYAKQLSTLAKSQAVDKFDGSIGKGWESLLISAQKESGCHQKQAEVFNQQFQLTNQLTKTLKQKAKEKEEEVRSCQNVCRLLYEKALKNKAQFIKKADQKNLLEEEKRRLKTESQSGSNSGAVTAKELQKMDASIKKAISAADASKQECVKTLEKLDVAKKQWESKTCATLTKFNEMERSRIIYLRGLFWKLMNSICETCVDVDKACDDVRNVLVTCDPDSDLDEFIISKRTGEKKPGKITFENLGKLTNSYSAPSNKSFKMSISRKLGSPWKIANGQATTADQPKRKNLRATSEQRKKEKESPAGMDCTPSCSDSCSAPASPSPGGSPPCKSSGEDGQDQTAPSKTSKQRKEEHRTSYCIVKRSWSDNQGAVLAQGGVRAKLLDKSSDALWLIELEDHTTLYCPKEHLQELPVGRTS